MLKTLSFLFYFVFPPCLSLWKSQSENLFYTEINIKIKEISKPLAQACLCTCIWASASCWIVLDTCQMSRMKLWNVRTALNMARQGDKAEWNSVPFTLSNADRITRKNKVMFYLVSLFLVAFVWFPWKVLPWYFSEIAPLFGMITGNHHFPEKELCLARWPAGERYSWPVVYRESGLVRSKKNGPGAFGETGQEGWLVRGEPKLSFGNQSEFWQWNINPSNRRANLIASSPDRW